MISIKETILGFMFIVWLICAFLMFFVGIGTGPLDEYHVSCAPNTIAQVLVPTYSLGCYLNRPISHWRK